MKCLFEGLLDKIYFTLKFPIGLFREETTQLTKSRPQGDIHLNCGRTIHIGSRLVIKTANSVM